MRPLTSLPFPGYLEAHESISHAPLFADEWFHKWAHPYFPFKNRYSSDWRILQLLPTLIALIFL